MDSSKWWFEYGQYYDPDTSDVPTIDKIPAIAQHAYDTAKAISGNYVANRETNPTEIKFANGRRVFINSEGFLDTDFSDLGPPPHQGEAT